MKIDRNAIEQPKAADIRAALGRIVASSCLNKSPQLAHFLTFVVDETLAGRGDRIKAYNVAADALGRDADFDPQNDPIVRVEAGRLRRALDHYYTNGGAGDPVVIDLPRGHYVPVFRANKTRRGAGARLRELRLQLTKVLRENYRLVLAIVVIATVVSLAVNLTGVFLAKSVWPAAGNASYAAPAVSAPPVPTGAVLR
jgi:hypothetical protein